MLANTKVVILRIGINISSCNLFPNPINYFLLCNVYSWILLCYFFWSLFVIFLLVIVCSFSFGHCLSFFFWSLFVIFLLFIVCHFSFGHCLSFFFWSLFVIFLLIIVWSIIVHNNNFNTKINNFYIRLLHPTLCDKCFQWLTAGR
jgi:hypothetical protein